MRRTILVIDDQWSMQEYARLVLQTAGYRVLLASDVFTGLSLARTEQPDVIVVDSRIPPLGGVDIIQVLRQDPHLATIPVILITLQSQEARVGDALDAPNILQKPFQPPALLTMVERLVEQEPVRMAV